MFLKQLEVGTMAVFCYIIGCEKTGQALVIDPAASIEKILHETKIHKMKINYILNTHGHFDHTSGNYAMKDQTKAKIIIHEKDSFMLTNMSPNADLIVQDKNILRIGELKIHILHTPGHTPGSICLLIDNYLFSGDTLFVGGFGRTDLPGGSLFEFIKSIKEKLLLLPDETIIFPGHNYGLTLSSTLKKEKEQLKNFIKHNNFL